MDVDVMFGASVTDTTAMTPFEIVFELIPVARHM
jgi:hypothetical protein